MLTDTRHSKNAKVYPVDGRKVTWTGGLMRERLETCEKSTVPQLQHMFEEKDISHVVENFRICAGEAEGDFAGTVFGDGDFYKWMESAVYTAVKTKDQALLDRIEEFIRLIGRAQQPDGYLSTKQIIGEMRQNGISRMGDINDFEVYNFGHMFTSACLHYRMTGNDSFLNIAVKTCDYLEKLYDTAEKTGDVQTAVCPSHYMGLAELYRTTGDERYLRLLHKAVHLRDSVKNGLDDNQDRIPLKEHDRIHGHAVRANYLYAGLADLCLEMGEEDGPAGEREEYLAVLHRVWNSLIRKKMYITGGCGALYNGVSPYGNFFKDQKTHQAYGYEYQLPNITAYNETCASLGGVFWAYRMFQLEPEAVYFDVLERMMLNTNLAAFSLDGKKFFYENTLRREKKLDYELVWPLTRSEYILSYCCPPNLARTVAESEEYAYLADRDGVWTGLYGDSRAEIRLENGAQFTLVQKTDYPYDGRICFFPEKTEGETFGKENHTSEKCSVGKTPFVLHLRIPGWAVSGTLELSNAERQQTGADQSSRPGGAVQPAAGSESIDTGHSGSAVQSMTGSKSIGSGHFTSMETLTPRDAGTYISVLISDPHDFCVTLTLEMPVRYTQAHSKVEEASGQVCVERGPLVYCTEGMDADAESLSDLVLDLNAEFKTAWTEIEGRKILFLESEQYRLDRTGYDREALYQTLAVCRTISVDESSAGGDVLSRQSASRTKPSEKYCIGGQKCAAGTAGGQCALQEGSTDRQKCTSAAGRVPQMQKTRVRMIPYFAWDNRGFDEMRIWFPAALQPQKTDADLTTDRPCPDNEHYPGTFAAPGTPAAPGTSAAPGTLPASLLSGLPAADPKQAEELLSREMRTFSRKIVVLDDDPTGVQTVSDISVYTDWEEDSIRQGFAEENSMFFILTNSRSFSAEKTAAVHREIARRVEKISRETGKEYFLISRGDSTLRGHYPLETDILADQIQETSGPVDGVILCPFFPEGGRYTFGDVHYVKDENELIPAGLTEFARDKTFGYRSSDLKEYAEEKSGGRTRAEDCITISLEELAALDVDGITGKLLGAENRTIVVVNAVTYADLKVFCAALVRAMKAGKRFVARTAAAFPKVMGMVPDKPLLTREDIRDKQNHAGGLVIVGSHVKKTTDQLECLRNSGLPLDFREFDVNSVFREDSFEADRGSTPSAENSAHRAALASLRREAAAFAEKSIREGRTAVIYTSRQLLAPENCSSEELLEISVRISDALTGIVENLSVKPGFLLAKGGITSSDVGTKGLKVKKARVMGQIKKGIPVWLTGPESRFPDLPYIIFPGNVGDVQTLREIVEEITKKDDEL